MKRIIYFVMAIVSPWFLKSCNTIPTYDGSHLKYVSVSVDSPTTCSLRYTIKFSHGESSTNTYTYGVGLRTPDNEWADTSQIVSMSPPFDDYTLSIVLTSGESLPPPTPVLEAFAFADLMNGPTETFAGHVDYPSFPVECCPFSLSLSDGSGEVLPGECVFITQQATMPALTASVTGATGMIDWNLTITYNRSGRNDTSSYETSLDAIMGWDISTRMYPDVRGGEATLVAYSPDESCSQTLSFGIRAYNPDESTVESYIDGLAGVMWYDKYVAEHESCCQNGRSYLQFNEKITLPYDCLPTDVRYTPNASANNDGGFGIYQLTNIGRPPNEQELWSWKQNAESGRWWLSTKQLSADNFMSGQRLEAQNSQIILWWPEDETVGNVTFSEFTDRPIDHAVALKKYNGLGIAPTWNYCTFNPNTYLWDFHRWARYYDPDGLLDSNSYVADVCSLVP